MPNFLNASNITGILWLLRDCIITVHVYTVTGKLIVFNLSVHLIAIIILSVALSNKHVILFFFLSIWLGDVNIFEFETINSPVKINIRSGLL